MNNFRVLQEEWFAPPTIAFVISRTFEDVINERAEFGQMQNINLLVRMCAVLWRYWSRRTAP